MRAAVPLVVVVISFFFVGCDADGEGEGEGDGPSPDLDAAVLLTSPQVQVAGGLDLASVASTKDGVVVAAMNTGADGNGVMVTRLKDDLTPLWATSFTVIGAPTDVLVDGDDTIVLAGQSGTPLHIARFDKDGALKALVEEDSAGSRAFVDDGDLVVMNNFHVKRYAPDFTPRWQKNIPAIDGVRDGDDYLLAGTPLRVGGTMTGIEVTRVTRDGELVWRSFQSPGPGTHSIAGLAVVGGNVVVAAGNDSTRADSTATLSPLIVARFNKDTGAPVDLKRFALFVNVEGTGDVPLQFGGGLSASVVGGTFYAGVIATSGGLGADLRTSLVVNLDDGSALNSGGAFAPSSDGALVSANARSDGLAVTRSASTSSSSSCGSPLAGGSFEVISAQTEFSDDGANVIDLDIATAASPDTATVIDVAAASVCGG